MTSIGPNSNGNGNGNGIMSPPQSARASTISSSPRIILAGKTARILCVADIRGDYHELNRLIREHEATAVIHTGDFGFLNAESLERMGDKILRHLIQYSPLLPPATRSQLLSIPTQAGRAALINQLNNSSIHFPLSQFPHLLSGAITFSVPVFTVWGLIEDVRIVEKFRTGEFEVNNLTVVDESQSCLVETAGLKLRLFGLGGAVAVHKLFDNGEGFATIAGGQGTMWTTALQLGELIDTAQRVFDPSETRILISSAPISRIGLLSLLSISVKADLTISGGLHFRYPVSFNEFAVNEDYESYRQKLVRAQDTFLSVYDVVKDRVEGSLNEHQQFLLKKVVLMVGKIPTIDDATWTNSWHWVLADASCGHLLLSVNEGRVSAEMRSHGLNFGHRAQHGLQPPSASTVPTVVPPASQPPRPSAAEVTKQAATTPSPANVNSPPKPPVVAPTPKQMLVPSKPAAPIAPVKAPPIAKPLTQPVRPVRPPVITPQAVTPSAASSAKAAEGKPMKERASPAPAKSSNKATPSTTPAPGPKKETDKFNGAHKTDNDDTEAPKNGPVSPKRFSLYLKGLPIPTTESEIKAFFGAEASKILAVKLPFDAVRRQQKSFAYVDFASESDMQEALAGHQSGNIRDTPITAELSNPPAPRFPSDRGRGRATLSLRGGRGSGRVPRGGLGGSPHVLTPKSETPKSETPKPEASKPEAKSEKNPKKDEK